MIFAALSEAADRGELILIDQGLCRYHLRKDGTAVIREILVLPRARKCGVGKRMVQEVARRCPSSPLVARCPAQDREGRVGAANSFWRHMGFTLVGEKGGINTWRRAPA